MKEVYPVSDSILSLQENIKAELEVKAVMTAGCVARMDITVVGEGKSSLMKTEEKEDIFTSDEIWEQMIRQAWLDIVKTINKDKALYGINLRPLLLDPLMPKPIVISEDMAGYHVSLASSFNTITAQVLG